jgi:hypothetical protein
MIAAMPERSILETAIGVEPQYLKKKLDGIETLLWLAAGGAALAAATSFLVLTRLPRR